ncbi:MAG: AAA family ATPase [Planctomycetes bacterium]|nr:AAA family ATPase [Planctomycetota bacterium]
MNLPVEVGGRDATGVGGRLASLVVGPWNRLAVLGLRESIDEPGRTNPVFVHGPEGLGKSRLLRAFADDLRSRYPAWKVVALAGPRLLSLYHRAIYERTIGEFRDRLRSADALVIDGVDSLQGKPSCQREMLGTMNDLANRERPITLSSRVAPRELREFLPQLVNRFLAGLSVPLRAPEQDSLTALVFQWGRAYRPPLSDEVLGQVAESFRGSPGALEKLLAHLVSYRRASRRGVTRQVVVEALALEEAGYGTPDVRRIAAAVAEHYGLIVEDITGERSCRRATHARRVAIYLATELTGLEQKEIGLALGNRTPSTVRFAKAEMKKKLDEDPAVREAILEIKRKLGV